MNLNQVSLPATDLGQSVAFYSRLGLRLLVLTETYARLELPEGEATLSLVWRERPMVDDDAGIHVYFECSDLDQRVAALQGQGIAFDSAPEDMRWLWREAWLRDPAGNHICLFRAGANRRHPPWRLA